MTTSRNNDVTTGTVHTRTFIASLIHIFNLNYLALFLNAAFYNNYMAVRVDEGYQRLKRAKPPQN